MEPQKINTVECDTTRTVEQLERAREIVKRELDNLVTDQMVLLIETNQELAEIERVLASKGRR